jgi:hypothetical protein
LKARFISTCWGVIGRLVERWQRDAIIVFLDTPVDECVRRVRARRLERGDERRSTQGFDSEARDRCATQADNYRRRNCPNPNGVLRERGFSRHQSVGATFPLPKPIKECAHR